MAEPADKIKWHPGFYGAAELEFRENKNDLEFVREVNLSKEPLRMDLLIIKKLTEIEIANEIGKIFRKYNIFEYKSPEDGLTIDDFFKTLGYACFYKALGEKVNSVRSEELTVSLVREKYPEELFSQLGRIGCAREEKYPGIFYITGNLLFPVQILVTGQLTKETHSNLRVLSREADMEDVKRFINIVRKFVDSGDKENADAVLEVSASANTKLYEAIREEANMCQALKEIMKDELAAAASVGEARGRSEGISIGVERTKKEYDAKLAALEAELEKYKTMALKS